MASNQTNRFQSLDSSVEEFIDGEGNENTKKKTKHDVGLFHEFLVFKGETIQFKIQACGFSLLYLKFLTSVELFRHFDANSYISTTVPYDKLLYCAWGDPCK